MDGMGPPGTWDRSREWLAEMGKKTLAGKPKAILVVSAHWEEPVATVLSHPNPPMLYDYYGFPKHTYALQWPAPGDPALAKRVVELLKASKFDAAEDAKRGFDHGTFIPLLVAMPKAEVPCVQVSLLHSLDPAQHVAMGRALAPLRDEGVLIISSGMSFHNMRAFSNDAQADQKSVAFDRWLNDVMDKPSDERNAALVDWAKAPGGRFAHPREEHLIPVHVAAGAADDNDRVERFNDVQMGAAVSGFVFHAK